MLYGVFGATHIICYRAVYSPPTGPIRIRGRLVAPRACEMALMVKTRSNGLSDSAERSPWSDVRVDASAFGQAVLLKSDPSD